MRRLVIREESSVTLDHYASVPIAFEVRSVLDVSSTGAAVGGFELSERVIDTPYVKDYDDIDDEHPSRWMNRFNVTTWGVFAAYLDGERIGGAVVAFDTPNVRLLDGRRDLALLWDIRVAPAVRGRGVGAALFHAAEEWAAERECMQLKAETQNVNVPACSFYARHGCKLVAIDRLAYPALPEEIQCIWCKDLPRPHRPPRRASRASGTHIPLLE